MRGDNIMTDQKEFLFSFGKNDILKLIREHLKDIGYENIHISDITYNCDFTTLENNNKIQVTPNFRSVLVAFEADGIVPPEKNK